MFQNIEQSLSKKKILSLKSYYSKITDLKIYKDKAKRAWQRINFKPNNTQELKNLKKYSEIREKLAMKKNIPVKRIITDSDLKVLSRDSVDKKLKIKILNKLNLKSKYSAK